jgi:ketosteroid isomerase-like protein
MLLLLIALPLFAEDSISPQERDSLLRTREDVWRAWFNHDLAKMRAYFPDEALAFDNGEEQWTDHHRIFRGSEEFAKSGGKLVRLEFPRSEVRRYGDVYILYSLYTYVTEQSGKRSTSSGRATEVFVKKGDRWLNPGWHTSK